MSLHEDILNAKLVLFGQFVSLLTEFYGLNCMILEHKEQWIREKIIRRKIRADLP